MMSYLCKLDGMTLYIMCDCKVHIDGKIQNEGHVTCVFEGC